MGFKEQWFLSVEIKFIFFFLTENLIWIFRVRILDLEIESLKKFLNLFCFKIINWFFVLVFYLYRREFI